MGFLTKAPRGIVGGCAEGVVVEADVLVIAHLIQRDFGPCRSKSIRTISVSKPIPDPHWTATLDSHRHAHTHARMHAYTHAHAFLDLFELKYPIMVLTALSILFVKA